MRYAFILMQISLTSNGKTHFLYRNNAPHSEHAEHWWMPLLMRMILSVASCLLRGKNEFFQGQVFKFVKPCQPHSFKIYIYTMDEKYEHHFCGLEPSSAILVVLCTYNKAHDHELLEKVPDEMMWTTIDTELQALVSIDNQDRKLSRIEKMLPPKGYMHCRLWSSVPQHMNPMQ